VTKPEKIYSLIISEADYVLARYNKKYDCTHWFVNECTSFTFEGKDFGPGLVSGPQIYTSILLPAGKNCI
jgi:hypothetical protein